ncbi:helix-turn-helix domain-containing protein [Corynebacterium provencense]|uniref:helix-turn-helix domain-containing protein n=1 Tax=Corynebacterium provencense TaxID=1737425 RepID=UPI0021C2E2F3|nr:AraC family transcriptional regulator [Corynebacterium provencense]
MMDAECGDIRSLADWSLELGIERGKLANMFERESGCSWGYWKREKRMTAARHFLSDTDRSVSSISRRLGYSNVSGFSRSFTEVHGVTPTEFREKNYLPLLVDLPPDLHD